MELITGILYDVKKSMLQFSFEGGGSSVNVCFELPCLNCCVNVDKQQSMYRQLMAPQKSLEMDECVPWKLRSMSLSICGLFAMLSS